MPLCLTYQFMTPPFMVPKAGKFFPSPLSFETEVQSAIRDFGIFKDGVESKRVSYVVTQIVSHFFVIHPGKGLNI